VRSPIANRWGVAFLASFFLLCQGVAQGLAWIDRQWDAGRPSAMSPSQTPAVRAWSPLEPLGPVAADPVCFDSEAVPMAGLAGQKAGWHF
jgi:hypothetical protein